MNRESFVLTLIILRAIDSFTVNDLAVSPNHVKGDVLRIPVGVPTVYEMDFGCCGIH